MRGAFGRLCLQLDGFANVLPLDADTSTIVRVRSQACLACSQQGRTVHGALAARRVSNRGAAGGARRGIPVVGPWRAESAFALVDGRPLEAPTRSRGRSRAGSLFAGRVAKPPSSPCAPSLGERRNASGGERADTTQASNLGLSARRAARIARLPSAAGGRLTGRWEEFTQGVWPSLPGGRAGPWRLEARGGQHVAAERTPPRTVAIAPSSQLSCGRRGKDPVP